MDFRSDPLPPEPYARVRLVGNWPWHCRNVPLHWLQDWPRALDPQTHILYAYQAPVGAAVFHCFHSPRGFGAKPTFRGISRRHEWDVTGRISAVYNVNVIEVVQPDGGAKALAQLPHAHVRLVSDGTRLTVPLAWLDAWNTLRVDANGVNMEKDRVLSCFYQNLAPPVDKRNWSYQQPKLSTECVPHLRDFQADKERAWYRVQVLRVGGGEWTVFHNRIPHTDIHV